MRIERKSPFSGKVNVMELPITQTQLAAWKGGKMIQEVFYFLSPSEREFIMTGITSKEWDDSFGSSDAAPTRAIYNEFLPD